MPPTPKPGVSDAELAVLKVLWKHGPQTVRQVESHLGRRKKWAYTTILTLLSRLREKGYAAQERAPADTAGAAHVFRAAVTHRQLLGLGLKDLADRMCDGTASPLVHALVESQRLSTTDIAHLRHMLDELERKGQP